MVHPPGIHVHHRVWLLGKQLIRWACWVGLEESTGHVLQQIQAVPGGCGQNTAGTAPASKPCCSALPFPSLGICPVSLPVLLPAEGAADQLPPVILTTQPHLGFLLQPPGQDLGERGKEEETPETGLCLLSETAVKIADLCPPVLSSCPRWASGNPWDRVPK